jgi:hypothetical protein
MEQELFSFGSVESLHNKVKVAHRYPEPERMFFAKPKLHGTNASIVFKARGIVYAQSRKNVLTLENDNAGFARWVSELNFKDFVFDGMTWILYGEWAGQGIGKNDAVTKIGKKAFFPICLRRIYSDDRLDRIDHEEYLIKSGLENMGIVDHPDIYIIPKIGEISICLNGNFVHLAKVETYVNTMVENFETVDPYIQKQFGVEAAGEGVVFYPDTHDWETYKNLMFKAKTEAHRVNKSNSAASAKVEVSHYVVEFAEKFATIQRFEQAMTEINTGFDMKSMGQFLKWVNTDILKESKDEIEESELNWKECAKEITNVSRGWFMNNAKRIT